MTAARLAVLRGRAVRTITQGHLSQHLFFHSLHQFAIPSRAPQIFGMSDQAFRDVRRTLELSPLTIARLHGRSPARVEALSVAALRERARAGVRGHAITPGRPACSCAGRSPSSRAGSGRRATTARPRPTRACSSPCPTTTRPTRRSRPTAPMSSTSSTARSSPWRCGWARSPSSRATCAAGATRSSAARPRRATRAAGPALGLQRDRLGRRALRRLRVLAGQRQLRQALRADRRPPGRRGRGRTTRIDHPPRGEDLSQSAYNPQLAADGRHLAFQAVRGAGTAQVFVCDLHTGTRTLASGGLPRAPRGTITSIYEPRVSADGRFVAFTAVTSPAAGGAGQTASRVVLRDLARAPRRRSATALPASRRTRPSRPTGAASPSPRASGCPSSTSATWPRTRPRR